MSLVGAVYGTLLVNAGKTYFSETLPDLWLFLMAGLFIGVVMAFPNGLAGLYEEQVKPWWARRRAQRARQARRLRRRAHRLPECDRARCRDQPAGLGRQQG